MSPARPEQANTGFAGSRARPPAKNKGGPLRTSKLHIRTPEPVMIADLDTLLTALYVELSLANPKLHGERDQARQTLEPSRRTAPPARTRSSSARSRTGSASASRPSSGP
jgi:hypothetical protein